METPPNRVGLILKSVVALVLVSAIVVVALGPTQEWVSRSLQFIDQLGVWGGLLFVLVYVIATVLFIPGSLLTVGAGFVFGPLWGTIAVSAGSTVGALTAFAIGRHFAGDWVNDQLSNRPRLQATIGAVEKDALKVVFLLRLVPLFPFNLLNYSLGLTEISWRKFLIASWLGMLPGTIAYVMVGSAAGSLTRALSTDGPADWYRFAFWAVGAVALVLVVTLVARRARQELDDG